MGEEETLGQHRSSITAPIILHVVFTFQFLSRWLEQLKKRRLRSDKELQLRKEITTLERGELVFAYPSGEASLIPNAASTCASPNIIRGGTEHSPSIPLCACDCW